MAVTSTSPTIPTGMKMNFTSKPTWETARDAWRNTYNQQKEALGLLNIPYWSVPSMPSPQAARYADIIQQQGYSWDTPLAQWIKRSALSGPASSGVTNQGGTSNYSNGQYQPPATPSPVTPTNSPPGTWNPRPNVGFNAAPQQSGYSPLPAGGAYLVSSPGNVIGRKEPISSNGVYSNVQSGTTSGGYGNNATFFAPQLWY